jgi:hypothetical protein
MSRIVTLALAGEQIAHNLAEPKQLTSLSPSFSAVMLLQSIACQDSNLPDCAVYHGPIKAPGKDMTAVLPCANVGQGIDNALHCTYKTTLITGDSYWYYNHDQPSVRLEMHAGRLKFAFQSTSMRGDQSKVHIVEAQNSCKIVLSKSIDLRGIHVWDV